MLRPNRALLTLAALTLPLVAACAAHPPQSQEHAAVGGIDTQVGAVLVRNVNITVTGGGAGLLAVYLYNNGADSDQLTGVSVGNGVSATVPGGTVDLPAGQPVLLNSGADQIALTGVPASARLGASLPVTFTFARAGTLTVQAPIDADAAGSATSTPGEQQVSPTPTPSSSVPYRSVSPTPPVTSPATAVG